MKTKIYSIVRFVQSADDEQELTSIAHGQLEYVIDLIPETDEVQDVTIP
ncbi:hypothetical protein [Heminiphilus faecis]|nr:hypothetical protein [Heminiphilus faecis]